MSKTIWAGIVAIGMTALICGCSFMVLASPDQGSSTEGKGNPNKPSAQAARQAPFLGHLSVKGMHQQNRYLMTSIVVHPALWEHKPYVLFDEHGFGKKYSHNDPMSINLNEIRAEAKWDAQTARMFWTNQPVHVMVNTEGWEPQHEATLRSVTKDTPEAIYNRHAQRVHLAIQSGVEAGWPEIDRFGWWAKIVDDTVVEAWGMEHSPLEINMQAASVWRRVSYMAPNIYPHRRLIPAGTRPGEYEATPVQWAKRFQSIVKATVELRDELGGDQLVLPCMFGTELVGPGFGKGRGRFGGKMMTEDERRLLVRTVYDSGADGIMVWQPIRTVAERDEFQRAIEHIEAELAQINGITDPGPTMTLGNLFKIRSDWVGRPMDWMREKVWERPSPSRSAPSIR